VASKGFLKQVQSMQLPEPRLGRPRANRLRRRLLPLGWLSLVGRLRGLALVVLCGARRLVGLLLVGLRRRRRLARRVDLELNPRVTSLAHTDAAWVADSSARPEFEATESHPLHQARSLCGREADAPKVEQEQRLVADRDGGEAPQGIRAQRIVSQVELL
jgi:hypothetical protein